MSRGFVPTEFEVRTIDLDVFSPSSLKGIVFYVNLTKFEVEALIVVITMQEITVTYNNKETCKLGEALLLEDAISDLPPVCLYVYFVLKYMS